MTQSFGERHSKFPPDNSRWKEKRRLELRICFSPTVYIAAHKKIPDIKRKVLPPGIQIPVPSFCEKSSADKIGQEKVWARANDKFGQEKVVLSEMNNLFLFHELLVIGKTRQLFSSGLRLAIKDGDQQGIAKTQVGSCFLSAPMADPPFGPRLLLCS